MPPASTSRKSILVIPSRVISRPDNAILGEETEIAAQITVPYDGGWGWVVVLSSFINIAILDGVAFTFGSLLPDIAEDLKIADTFIALINSVAISTYFVAAPIVSGFINRYGFRFCAMVGSFVCGISLFISYLASNYVSLLIFYGLFAGLGYALINMAAGLVVGFYFEKYRALAFSISNMGSSFGIMVMSPLNAYLVSLAGWRIAILIHSSMFGMIYFISMTYRPLLSMTVAMTLDDPTRTVTYLPSLSTTHVRRTGSVAKVEGLKPNAAEKLFGAVSNYNFPTAAAVVDDGIVAGKDTSQAGSSTPAVSKLTLVPNNKGMTENQRKQVKSMMSRMGMEDNKNIQVALPKEPVKKPGCCGRLCRWEPDVPESRPMYRDDAFYDGKLERLPEYQKSMMATNDAKSGLEYQLAVSRAAAESDLREKRGICTTAVRRTLSTMLDMQLLRKGSYILICFSSLFLFLGLLIPYIFLADRNALAGVDQSYCSWFISSIGFASMIGRLILGFLAAKIDPIKLSIIAYIICGSCTTVSDVSFDPYFQFAYCGVFGFFTGGVATLRSLMLVDLYGLNKLTNSSGVVILFQGIGSLVSSPIGGLLKDIFGYKASFIFCGVCILISGFLLMPVRFFSSRENKKRNRNNVEAKTQDNKKTKTEDSEYKRLQNLTDR